MSSVQPADPAGSSSRSDRGSGKCTLSSRIRSSWIVASKLRLEVLDALLDDLLRGAGAGGDQDRSHAVEPFVADLGHAVDQVRGASQRVGDLGQPSAVRAVLAAQDQHQVGRGPPARGRPPGGSASRSRCRPWSDWRSGGTSFVARRSRCWRRRRSGSSGSGRRLARGRGSRASRRPRRSRPGSSGRGPRPWCRSPRRAPRGRSGRSCSRSRAYLIASRWTLVTSGQVASIATRFRGSRLVADLRRDAVGTVEERRASGTSSSDSTNTVPSRRNLLDDELVVDDLVIDVQRRPEELEGPLEALDGHVDPGAEAPGIRQDDLHQRSVPRLGRHDPRCRSAMISGGSEPAAGSRYSNPYGMPSRPLGKGDSPDKARGTDAAIPGDRGRMRRPGPFGLLESRDPSLLQFHPGSCGPGRQSGEVQPCE